MYDLRISDMMKMQRELFELHKDKWSPMEPDYGKDYFLWMIEEIGESIQIIKKKGNSAIMNDKAVRKAFCEEMSDVLMYFNDILLRYSVSPKEISEAYVSKHSRNMGRNFSDEYKNMYTGEN